MLLNATVNFAQECPATSSPSRDGRDGRDGRNGIDGKNGRDGMDGKDGVNGIDGKDGKNGKDGVNGVDGKDGKNGKNGNNGFSSNWKECAWKDLNENKDNGVVMTCSFKKQSNDTSLKVFVASNLRITNCDICCKRWYVTFNGTECSNPVPIDGVVYMWKGKGTQNLHRPRVIAGHCHKVPTGTVNVQFNVGNCRGYGNADAYTGWNSSSRIFIEEVPQPQA